MRERFGCGGEIDKPSFFRFGNPFVCIVIAVEQNLFMLLYRFADEEIECLIEIGGVFEYIRKIGKSVADSGVQHCDGTCR